VSAKRVLMLEDEPALAKLFTRGLEKVGIEVVAVDRAADAVRRATREHFDLISLDYLVPDGNGLDVYRAIRERHPDTPILFVSGNVEFQNSMTGLRDADPAVDHMAKPFKMREYRKRVVDWLV
jgi:two-component system response regulator BaeR